jgi:integrase
MAIHKLAPNAAAKLDRAGLHSDGAGLYLSVGRNGARSWIFRFRLAGRAREMGLGSTNVLSLSDARQKAQDARKLVAEGIDPIEARNARREARKLEAAKAVTFDQGADTYIAAHRSGWKNDKHADQWTSTIRTYASPVIGKLPMQVVDTPQVLEVLQPIWTSKPETAHRVRGRIEKILDWAKVMKYRAGENPARWRGHLDYLLPARGKVKKVRHHPALPYRKLSEFMVVLRDQEGTAARALEFTILTTARTNETIAARFDQIENRVWTIGSEHMKGDRAHRVPLCARAIEIVEEMRGLARNEFVFPAGNSRGEHLSNMAMLNLLGRMGHGDITTHGFRSSFKDWARERTNFPNEVSEAALAHVIGDETERAYARGDLFEKRRKLMDAWANYCAKPTQTSATVTPLRQRHA